MMDNENRLSCPFRACLEVGHFEKNSNSRKLKIIKTQTKAIKKKTLKQLNYFFDNFCKLVVFFVGKNLNSLSYN